MIAIVDYQMGNLRSVQKAFESKGFKACITQDKSAILDAGGVVLPGVGAFGDCYKELSSRKLIEPLLEWIQADRPFLGICLGLQVLLNSSEESKGVTGLHVIPGTVKRFSANGLKVPHMGWNQVRYPVANGAGSTSCPLFEGIPNNTYFYFVHSYFVQPESIGIVSGWTTYGSTFASAVWRGNLFATQFHPEKSQEAGLKIIENFGALALRTRADNSKAGSRVNL
ncbi:MAG: imidazole glycerol phosphate synthase subunit HisH [Candidatus Abyssobacteria bacterium SURF_5]|uniref:Imidazole glycerol phosphate synthase subunit HisH n=1 Tax=Abyssobacteria bacterium (strain SURF_5) TaxID=2093360 RepID=A0A3A4NT67_ABYX5|nr:MAG: imidazole glycerol phosphate synthase subunit HisH [Candidatus Abyssubacteria bacterium SURF_5]